MCLCVCIHILNEHRFIILLFTERPCADFDVDENNKITNQCLNEKHWTDRSDLQGKGHASKGALAL